MSAELNSKIMLAIIVAIIALLCGSAGATVIKFNIPTLDLIGDHNNTTDNNTTINETINETNNTTNITKYKPTTKKTPTQTKYHNKTKSNKTPLNHTPPKNKTNST